MRRTMIKVDSVCKAYGSNQAVDNISLHIKEGELFGIIGTNGAGKTTLLEMLMGLRQPDKGQIEVLGINPAAEATELQEHIGLHLQSISLVDKLNVREALEMFRSFYKCSCEMKEIIDRFGLESYLDRPVRRLSGGWRQRVALAISVVNNPKIIFLDEPTTGLDMQAREEYWSIILELKRQGKTIVLSCHDMGEMQHHCDRIAVLRQGNLVKCDTPKRLISQIPAGGLTMEAVYVHFAYAGAV
ncbi:ABC transporter ATP-binding protein [Paenibacillus sp. KS-LC4]|uniref:ABC transporter ATP-binding protein n=1 Tax=Paenibacillus sp. KS-LC4 TaxID=2979727 RepID=UPI0030D32EC8